MAAFRWMGPLRPSARRWFLNLLRQGLATDDSRRILADTLRGLTLPGDLPPRAALHSTGYADLPTADRLPSHRSPVFITARFRSGSTLVWNMFRHVPGCRAFYEPLNERRWFDPAARGARIDRTHIGVEDYWAEYEGLGHLSRWFHDDWTYRRLFLRPADWEPDLAAYIDGLIHSTPGRAVLQFNRVDFRLPWLRRQFPHARLLHLYRHPRNQWCSSLVDPRAFPPNGTMEAFSSRDHFYLIAWAEELSCYFPFLDPRQMRRPYELFYCIWRLSYDFGRAYADASFAFEALCEAPRDAIPRLMAAAGVSDFDGERLTALVSAQHADKWREYASADWFEEQETRCEEMLARVRD